MEVVKSIRIVVESKKNYKRRDRLKWSIFCICLRLIYYIDIIYDQKYKKVIVSKKMLKK